MINKLNIGCGKDIKIDYINLDSANLPGVNIVHNLNNYPYPFKDNVFTEVNASMIIEHLTDWNKAMEEIWRICSNGAKIYIRVPFFPSYYAVTDPTHKAVFTYYTFDYYEPGHPLGEYYFKAKFKVIKKYIRYSETTFLNFLPALIFNAIPRIYSRYLCFIFPSNILEVELEVVK